MGEDGREMPENLKRLENILRHRRTCEQYFRRPGKRWWNPSRGSHRSGNRRPANEFLE